MMICPKCGCVLPNDSKYCQYCGTELPLPQEKPEIGSTSPRKSAPKVKGLFVIAGLILLAIVIIKLSTVNKDHITIQEDYNSYSDYENEFEFETNSYYSTEPTHKDDDTDSIKNIDELSPKERIEFLYEFYLEDRMEETDSTALAEVAYSAEIEMLAVRFRNTGYVYVYEDVPSNVWDALWEADSMGSYFNYYIRDNYDYCRIN